MLKDEEKDKGESLAKEKHGDERVCCDKVAKNTQHSRVLCQYFSPGCVHCRVQILTQTQSKGEANHTAYHELI